MPHFDTFPAGHTLLSFSLCGGLLAWLLLFPARARRWFVPVALAGLFFLRLPSLVYDQEINPDESQMIAQALTLGRYDPVYLRAVDGTTGGPLDSYLLILPALLGLPYDYITAHLTACLLVAVSLWLLYGAGRVWFGSHAARLALLPVVFVLGLTQNADFLHYNSELVAVLLLSGACWLYARQTTLVGLPPVGMLFLTGFLLGMVPFGKLQGLPLAGMVGLFVALDVLLRTGATRQKGVRLAGLLAGGLAFSALFVGFMAATGELADFGRFYIEGNMRYAGGGSLVQNLLRLPGFLYKGNEFLGLVVLTIIVGAVGWLAGRRSAEVPTHTLPPTRFWFLTLLTLATLLAITRTGSEYVHYLYFLVGPLFFWLAAGWQAIGAGPRQAKALLPGVLLGLGLAGKAALVLLAYRAGTGPVNPYPTDGQPGWTLAQSPLVQRVGKYARPGEPLAVWGWRCDYYVQARMPQGVAENHTIRCVFDHPLRAAYQQRYVQDMARTRPPVFVDAVGRNDLWMTDRATQGHEIYPPLKALIAREYQLTDTVSDSRVYVRRDRLAQPVLAERRSSAAKNY
jgi:hypothetical protein